jgi:hypothetical protein
MAPRIMRALRSLFGPPDVLEGIGTDWGPAPKGATDAQLRELVEGGVIEMAAHPHASLLDLDYYNSNAYQYRRRNG